jgi:membrane fusion protein (multidrug efflux system)
MLSIDRLLDRASCRLRRTCHLLPILFLLLVPLVVGCSQGEEAGGASQDADTGRTVADTAKAADGEAKSEEKTEKAIKVDVAEVRRGDLVLPIHADGTIRTPRSLEIRTKIGGELAEVHVQDGDHVTAGQLLARIDPRQYRLALEEARYRHFQALSLVAAEADTYTVNNEALADFAARRRELDRLYDKGTLDRQEHQARVLELELSALQRGAFRQEVFEQRTGLAEARLAEERAKLDLENTEIRAPFAGVVEGVDVVAGESISASGVICSLYDNERLEAAVHVLEADLGDLEVGRPVLLAVPATGDTLRAAVDVISPHLDEMSRTCQVLVRFDNPDGRFRPGMFVRAQIAGWIHPDRLLVPKEAVLIRDDRPLVFKVDGDRAQWLYITKGQENADWVEVLQVHSGGTLEAGDRVVVSDHLTLAHEARIDIRRTRAPTDRWHLADQATATAATTGTMAP